MLQRFLSLPSLRLKRALKREGLPTDAKEITNEVRLAEGLTRGRRASLIEALDLCVYIKDHPTGLAVTATLMCNLGQVMERADIRTDEPFRTDKAFRSAGGKGGKKSGANRRANSQKARDHVARHIHNFMKSTTPIRVERTIAEAIRKLDKVKWDSAKYGKRPTDQTLRNWYKDCELEQQLKQEVIDAGDD